MRHSLLLVPVALLVGCGGSSENAARDDSEQRALQFASCMREHGIDVPDPVAGRSGEMVFRARAGRRVEGPDPKRMEDAMKACRKYAPDGGRPASAAEEEEMRDRALAFSKCMRSHGVTDFPDPKFTADGGVLIGGPGSNIDSRTPSFQAAQKACGPPLGRAAGPGISHAP